MEPVQQLTFPEDRSAERLDSFLAESLPELSRSQIKKMISARQILLDGAPAKASVKLKGGELIVISRPEPEPIKAIPEDLPLKVLYEDAHLIVIDKAAGMVVHPAAGHYRGTLVNALLHHCQDLAGIGGELRPGIVHRIDKDTSGVLVVTKTDRSHQHLAEQFKQHTVRRHYVALVCGEVKRLTGTVDQPIGRHNLQRKKMSSHTRRGKRAVTHWQVLKRYPEDRLTLVACTLETGRTHQIRVHFSEMNLPLLGDPLYGGRSRIKSLSDPALRALAAKLSGQALHAGTLGFVHPVTGEYLEFSSELPDVFNAIVAYLEQKYADPQPAGRSD